MKVPKERFWRQNIILSITLCICVIGGQYLLNTHSGTEYGEVAILALLAFIVAVLQVIFCLYYFFFVEDEKRSRKTLFLLVIISLTLIEYVVGIHTF